MLIEDPASVFQHARDPLQKISKKDLSFNMLNLGIWTMLVLSALQESSNRSSNLSAITNYEQKEGSYYSRRATTLAVREETKHVLQVFSPIQNICFYLFFIRYTQKKIFLKLEVPGDRVLG